MPVHHIAVDVELTPDEERALRDVLRCSAQQLDAQIARFGVAAIREYLDMFMGTAPLTSGAEIRERRLLGLMLTAYSQDPPDPDDIARLFNVTPTAARSLLRSVAAKHRFRLKEQTAAALKAVLDACHHEAAGGYTVVETNRVLVELLNGYLEASPEPKTAIRRSGDSLTKYTVDEGSYDYLRAIFP
jgi:hypothetical protein